MSLIIKNSSRWWYGLFSANGRRKSVNLGVKIGGRRPDSLTQTGDDEFERSRGAAQVEYATVLGLRDRALLTLLYGTGIRASECAGLREVDIDWAQETIFVVGKGGHERTLPLNEEVVHILKQYRQARGPLRAGETFFRSRESGAMSRNAIYERVRLAGRKARIEQRVSPHRLRHTFATHLVRAGVGLVTLRDLLGHRQITSTQIYIHLTAQDLRKAADRHPIAQLIRRVEDLLPDVRLPLQRGAIWRVG